MTQRRLDAGFPARARRTPVPDLFFSRYLPRLHDAAQAKVFLHILWRIHRRERGQEPALRVAELRADPTLTRSLRVLARGGDAGHVEGLFFAALDDLVELGLLLEASVLAEASGTEERWVWLNSAEGRSSQERMVASGTPEPEPLAEAPLTADDANIFTLYEETIGPLTPLLADELAEAEARFPPAWIEDAFRATAEANVRKWSYTRAILERWSREGRRDGTDRQRGQNARTRYIEGPYSDFVES